MNKDWTDELKKVLANSEITPSRDRWDEIAGSLSKAPKHVLFPVWSRYAAVAAAACLAVGSFLWFGQNRTPVDVAEVSSELLSDVIDMPSVPSEPEEVADIYVPDAVAPAKVAPVTNTVKAAEIETVAVKAESAADEVEPAADEAIDVVPDEAGVIVPDEVRSEERAAEAVDDDEEYLPVDWAALPGDEDEGRGRVADAFSVGLFAGGMSDVNDNASGSAAAVDYHSNYVSGMTISRVKKKQPTYSHMLPISFGLAVDYDLDDHWYLESGATYTFLRSTSSFSEQRLHMLGVPLRLNYKFMPDARFSVFAGAGGMGEVCLAATRDGDRMREDGIQWSASAVAGVAVRILPSVSLTISPEFSYFFTNTVLPTYRTEHPAGFSLRAGLSFNL